MRFLFGILTLIAFGLIAWWDWTETGLFEWWAGVVGTGDGLHAMAVFLLNLLTPLIPLGILGTVILGKVRATQIESARAMCGFGMYLGGALVAISAACSVVLRPAAHAGSFPEYFARVSVMPSQFVIDPRHMPPVESRFAARGAPASSPSWMLASPTLYIPFKNGCWPDPATPVILKTSRAGIAQIPGGVEQTFTATRRPVPLLARQYWKGVDFHFAIIVTRQNVMLDYWMPVWIWAWAIVLFSAWMRQQVPLRIARFAPKTRDDTWERSQRNAPGH